MIKESNFVNDCFALAREIEGEAMILERLSAAFHLTGNDKMSDKLYRRVEKLNSISEKFRSICREKTSEDLKNVEEMSGTILKACLGRG